MNYLPRNLKYLRSEIRKSQEAVRSELELGDGKNLSNYETGKRDPDYGTLIKLADYYGVTTDDLLRTDIRIERFKKKYIERTQADIEKLQKGIGEIVISSDIWKEYKKNTEGKQWVQFCDDPEDYEEFDEEEELNSMRQISAYPGIADAEFDPELEPEKCLDILSADIKKYQEQLLQGEHVALEKLVAAYDMYDRVDPYGFSSYPENRIDDIKSILIYAAIAYDSVASELIEIHRHSIGEIKEIQ